MSVRNNLAKTEFLKTKTSTSTRIGYVGEQKPWKTKFKKNKKTKKKRRHQRGLGTLVGKNPKKTQFLKVETPTSTRMGHVGEQKPCEN